MHNWGYLHTYIKLNDSEDIKPQNPLPNTFSWYCGFKWAAFKYFIAFIYVKFIWTDVGYWVVWVNYAGADKTDIYTTKQCWIISKYQSKFSRVVYKIL